MSHMPRLSGADTPACPVIPRQKPIPPNHASRACRAPKRGPSPTPHGARNGPTRHCQTATYLGIWAGWGPITYYKWGSWGPAMGGWGRGTVQVEGGGGSHRIFCLVTV